MTKQAWTIVCPDANGQGIGIHDQIRHGGFNSQTCGHLHRTRRAADACEKRRAPWYVEHHIVKVDVLGNGVVRKADTP